MGRGFDIPSTAVTRARRLLAAAVALTMMATLAVASPAVAAERGT